MTRLLLPLVGLAVLALAPLACTSNSFTVPQKAPTSIERAVSPTPPVLPESTVTGTPTVSPTAPDTATPTATVTPTENIPVFWTPVPSATWVLTLFAPPPMGPTPTPYVFPDCNPVAYRTPSLYPFVDGYQDVKNQAELTALWSQSYFWPDPMPTPDVDFSTERVVSHGIYSSDLCVNHYTLIGVCEEADRIVVREQELVTVRPYSCGYVFCAQAVMTQQVAVILPRSPKPVVWQVVRIDPFWGQCSPLAEPVTTVSEPVTWAGIP